MNQEKIFEELNKMKNLMVAKPGTVISEEPFDKAINDIVRGTKSISLSSYNELLAVNAIVDNTKTKQDFVNLLNQFKEKTGKNLGDELGKVLTPNNDKVELKQLTDHLKSLGIDMRQRMNKYNKWDGTYYFNGLDELTPQPTSDENKQQDTEQLSPYPWIAQQQQLQQQQALATQQRAQALQAINNRFIQGAESLGVENPTMDVQTLQTILNQLNS